MSDLHIKLATMEDFSDFSAIMNDAAAHKQSLGDTSWRQGFPDSGIRWMIDRGDSYIAFLGDKAVACVGLVWDDEQDQEAWAAFNPSDGGYVHRLAVHRDFGGQGLGKQVLDWAADQVRQKGRHYLRFDVSPNNPGLCAYYEKLGFERVGTYTFLADPDNPEFTAALYQYQV